jgi:hypothetical protein
MGAGSRKPQTPPDALDPPTVRSERRGDADQLATPGFREPVKSLVVVYLRFVVLRGDGLAAERHDRVGSHLRFGVGQGAHA